MNERFSYAHKQMSECELNLVGTWIADDTDCIEQLFWTDYFLSRGVPDEYLSFVLAQRLVLLASLPNSQLAHRTAH